MDDTALIRTSFYILGYIVVLLVVFVVVYVLLHRLTRDERERRPRGTRR